MRIATYNIEWFDALFDDDGALLEDDGWSGRRDVTRAEQIDSIATVLRAIEADAILIVEAPDISRRRNGRAALEHFAAAKGLRTREALAGFSNDTQQELILLYDPDILTARHDPKSSHDAPRFDQSFEIDLDIDAQKDQVVFSKPPLELALDTPLGPLRMIGCHVKSKAPHGAKTEAHAMRLSIANRRKQLAQCIWLRARIAAHLEADAPLIVLGDLNDGPGLDEYEKLFGRSGLEIVLGASEPDDRRLFDPHAMQALGQKMAAQPATARFFLRHENRFLSALLDYIMVSPALRSRALGWRIWHPFDDLDCWRDTELRNALLHASDHFPVTLDLGSTP
ncbi:MAG: endonuclease/exonuclease/phosphatase family protein [Pseudomonadota bacterium]